ncbi:retrovirus-related Pol polyprotein from transposon TNT 1-94 [Trichonephila clavipes]|nr:retrovirus-related Pol polyprotein from transposon TNT 1-94 [Trichonephila clavipes]
MKDYIDIDNVNNFACETCDISKVTRKTHHSFDINQSSQILELLHADLCGPINIESYGGAKYFMAEATNCSTQVSNVTPRKEKEKITLEIWTESYSPVVNMESFRLLIVLAAKLKLNVNFFDVKIAYLYGDLKETVYVLPPPGYEKLIGDDKVCKLKKSIYEKRHYNLGKRVLRYLMSSKDKKLFYEKEFGILNASSDASWGNAENGKSFSGGVVLLANWPPPKVAAPGRAPPFPPQAPALR